MDDYSEALLRLTDEQAEWAMALRGDAFWDYLRGCAAYSEPDESDIIVG